MKNEQVRKLNRKFSFFLIREKICLGEAIKEIFLSWLEWSF
jgi:hypothetical protein